MAQTKSQIQSILADANGSPRHQFGQNFMIDGNLVRLVAEAGDIQPGDTVIEIGPGTGTLTGELLDRVGATGRVIAVEIDRNLARNLQHRMADEPRFILIEGDALAGKHQLNPALLPFLAGGNVRLVANLPYNIASPLVVEMLLAGAAHLAFTVQKEVAERLCAPAGQSAYGPLSVVVQAMADVEILRTLPPQAFWPMPKVDSALVRVCRHAEIPSDARGFSRFVHLLFSSRRKMLRRTLQQAGHDVDAVLTHTGLQATDRPERLTVANFLSLWRAVQAAPSDAKISYHPGGDIGLGSTGNSDE